MAACQNPASKQGSPESWSLRSLLQMRKLRSRDKWVLGLGVIDLNQRHRHGNVCPTAPWVILVPHTCYH